VPILLLGANFLPHSGTNKNPLSIKQSEQIDMLAYGLNQATELQLAADSSPVVASVLKADFMISSPEKTFAMDERWLSDLLDEHPSNSEDIAIRLALIGNAAGTDQCKAMTPYHSRAVKVMQCILCDPKGKQKIPLDQCLDTINTALPKGWFRDTASLAAFKQFGDTPKLDSLRNEQKSRTTRFVCLTLASFAAYIVGTVTGLIVIIMVIAKTLREKELRPWRAEWGFKKIWCIFLLALYAQGIVGLCVYAGIRTSAPDFSASTNMIIVDILTIISTAIIVVISTRQFLLKPGNLTLIDGLQLSPKQCGVGRSIAYGFLAYCAALTLVLATTWLERLFVGHTTHSENPITLRMVSVVLNADASTIFWLLLTAGVMAPIWEEILFRGLIYPYLRQRLSMWPAALISGALFSVCHWDIPMIMQLLVIGTVQAVVFERTRSLTTAIVTHGLWNSGMLISLVLLRP
jgi:membrane protease YdiL (CAAX protease family)